MSTINYVAVDPDNGKIYGMYTAEEPNVLAIQVAGKELIHRPATEQDFAPPEEIAPYVETDFEKDRYRYLQRAAAKDLLIAEMAAENVGRIRSGVWTVQDLVALTSDPEISIILQDIHSLSFELAASKLLSCSNSLLTTEIKQTWAQRLMSHA